MAKRYSDKEKASALALLAANGGNVNRTAHEAGIPRKTLEQWAKDRTLHPDVAELRQEKILELSELLENEIRAIFDSMKTKRPEALYSTLGVVAGILIDKKQLLDGKATQRSEVVNLSDDERAERITSLLERARARRDGDAAEERTLH